MAVFPFTLYHCTVEKRKSTLSVKFTVFKFTGVFTAVSIGHYSVSIVSTGFEFTCIGVSVRQIDRSLTAEFTIPPFSCKGVAVSKTGCNLFAVFPLTIHCPAVGQGYNSFAMGQIIFKQARLLSAIRIKNSSPAVPFTFFPFSAVRATLSRPARSCSC